MPLWNLLDYSDNYNDVCNTDQYWYYGEVCSSKSKCLALETTLLEIYFLPFLGFLMLLSFKDVLNFKFLSIISSNAKVFSDREQAQWQTKNKLTMT